MGVRVQQRKLNQDGYRRVGPLEMFGVRRGLTMEHVVVVSKAIGKWLRKSARVHHVNEDRQDNRPGNLVACDSVGYHSLLHARTDALNACGNPNYRRCSFCGTWDAPGHLHRAKSHWYHLKCAAEWQADYRSAHGDLIRARKRDAYRRSVARA
jgi:hypothetical protein